MSYTERIDEGAFSITIEELPEVVSQLTREPDKHFSSLEKTDRFPVHGSGEDGSPPESLCVLQFDGIVSE